MADSPHLAGLNELSFGFEAFTTAGAAQFFRSALLARLTRLRFHHSALRPLARETAVEPGALRSLVLSGVSLTSPYLLELVGRLMSRRLVELDLSRNQLGPAAVAALATSPTAQGLESLTMWQTAPGVAGVRALAALPNLRRLSLCDCDLGSGAAKALAGSPHLRNLTVLDLAGNAIGDEGALALAASPHLRNLADLNLIGAELTDRGAAALLESPVTARLVRLGVSGNLSAEMFARVRERFG